MAGRAESYVLEFCKEVHKGSRCPYQSDEACLKWNLNETNIKRMHRHGQWHGDWGKGTPQLNWVIGIRRARNQTVLSRRKSNRTGLLSFQRPRHNATALTRRQQQQSRHQHHRHHNRTSAKGGKMDDGAGEPLG